MNDRAKLAVGSVTWIAGTTSVPSVTKAELKVKCTASTGGVSAIWFSLSTICCSVMVAVKSELTWLCAWLANWWIASTRLTILASEPWALESSRGRKLFSCATVCCTPLM